MKKITIKPEDMCVLSDALHNDAQKDMKIRNFLQYGATYMNSDDTMALQKNKWRDMKSVELQAVPICELLSGVSRRVGNKIMAHFGSDLMPYIELHLSHYRWGGKLAQHYTHALKSGIFPPRPLAPTIEELCVLKGKEQLYAALTLINYCAENNQREVARQGFIVFTKENENIPPSLQRFFDTVKKNFVPEDFDVEKDHHLKRWFAKSGIAFSVLTAATWEIDYYKIFEETGVQMHSVKRNYLNAVAALLNNSEPPNTYQLIEQPHDFHMSLTVLHHDTLINQQFISSVDLLLHHAYHACKGKSIMAVEEFQNIYEKMQSVENLRHSLENNSTTTKKMKL